MYYRSQLKMSEISPSLIHCPKPDGQQELCLFPSLPKHIQHAFSLVLGNSQASSPLL